MTTNKVTFQMWQSLNQILHPCLPRKILMKNYSFLLLILTSAVFTAAPVKAVPVAQTKPPASEKLTSAPTLTLQDLPAGFQELPAELRPGIAAQLDIIKRVLGQQNLSLGNYFAFVNPQQLEVVLGFNTTLPNQPLALLKFDAGLRQLQQPKARQQLVSQVEQGLKASPIGIKVIEQAALPDLNNLANASAGMTLALQLQSLPSLRSDIVAFRRNQVGSLTAVFYLDGSKPAISLKDVATKLDDRILQSSPTASSSRSSNR